eukprot:2586742-Prymnesium_polylepis.1
MPPLGTRRTSAKLHFFSPQAVTPQPEHKTTSRRASAARARPRSVPIPQNAQLDRVQQCRARYRCGRVRPGLPSSSRACADVRRSARSRMSECRGISRCAAPTNATAAFADPLTPCAHPSAAGGGCAGRVRQGGQDT